jgi:hypothetical protein
LSLDFQALVLFGYLAVCKALVVYVGRGRGVVDAGCD